MCLCLQVSQRVELYNRDLDFFGRLTGFFTMIGTPTSPTLSRISVFFSITRIVFHLPSASFCFLADLSISIASPYVRSFSRSVCLKRLKTLYPAYLRMPDGSVSLEWVRLCWSGAMQDSYWHAFNNPAVKKDLSNMWLSEHGLYSLVEGWTARKGVPTAECL